MAAATQWKNGGKKELTLNAQECSFENEMRKIFKMLYKLSRLHSGSSRKKNNHVNKHVSCNKYFLVLRSIGSIYNYRID